MPTAAGYCLLSSGPPDLGMRGHEIPEGIFTDFSADSRFILTTKWVRKN